MKDRSFATALHILTALAYAYPERLCSDTMAKGAQTNPGVIRRILAKLSKAGLVDTLKGKNGGTALGRPCNQISLLEIYEAVNESPVFASFDKDPYKPCPVSCQIGGILSEVFEEIEEPMLKKMNQTKLSKILERID